MTTLIIVLVVTSPLTIQVGIELGKALRQKGTK